MSMSCDEDEKLATFDASFFSFPYDPYAIQLDLMKKVWDTIEKRHVGIFESPTGTGKSMSLICATLTWINSHTDNYGIDLQSQEKVALESESAAEPAWLSSCAHHESDHALAESKKLLDQSLQPIFELKNQDSEEKQRRKRKIGQLASYYQQPKKKGTWDKSKSSKSQSEEIEEPRLELESSVYISSHGRMVPEKPISFVRKIIYCSRTHSQISQFLREIQKTKFDGLIRSITLGSRKNLCIHPQVAAKKSDAAMAEDCLDLIRHHKSSSGSAKSCPYYQSELLPRYAEFALADIQDIEDLHLLGKELSVCPYYGTRQGLEMAQVIALPYAMILNSNTRASLQIDLKDNIVIFDEAHNILDTIQNIYGVTLGSKDIVCLRRTLWQYNEKYQKRLKGQNCFFIQQLIAILEHLAKFLRRLHQRKAPHSFDAGDAKRQEDTRHEVMTSTTFLCEAGMDHFNLFKLLDYLETSNLCRKLMGFIDAQPHKQEAEQDEEEMENIHPLRTFQSFLRALSCRSSDGKILIRLSSPSQDIKASFQFLLLNPAKQFEDIVQQARAVIFAGGTMQPVQHLIDQLLPSVDPENIDLFTCGHVIPHANLTGFTLSCGPTQRRLRFTFARRECAESLDELGRIILNLSRIVPNGIVIFFPSYSFQNAAVDRWKATSQMLQIEKQKPVFREAKQANQVDEILKEYSDACSEQHGSRGAILFSVVGGKMSEGINFSDHLARCVAVVGLPYPNARDPEIVEQMAYLDSMHAGGGKQYYDNLCMKAVNQSIGRAIRHRNDYAAILLIDERYSAENIRRQLPNWIQEHMVQSDISSNAFQSAYSSLVKFYAHHRDRAKQISAKVPTL